MSRALRHAPAAEKRWSPGAIGLLAVAALMEIVWCAAAALTAPLSEAPDFTAAYLQALSRAVPGVGTASSVSFPGLTEVHVQAGSFVLLLIVECVLCLSGAALLDRVRLSTRTALRLVLGAALVYQLTLFLSPGLLSTDVLDYESWGSVFGVFGLNPYLVPPASLPATGSVHGAWASIITVYPPLWTHLDSALAHLIPDGNQLKAVFAYRVLGFAEQIFDALLLWWLLRRWTALGMSRGRAVAALALFAWNPLVLFEIGASAHNDGLAITFILLACVPLTLLTGHLERVRDSRPSAGHPLLWLGALVALELGALTKESPALIGGIVLLVWLARLGTGWQRVGALVAGGLVGGAIFFALSWPWITSLEVLRVLVSVPAPEARYVDTWMDVPAGWIASHLIVRSSGLSETDAEWLARGIVAWPARLIFLGIAGAALFQLGRAMRENGPRLIRSMIVISASLLLAALVLLVTQQLAWYYVWPLPLALLAGRRSLVAQVVVASGMAALILYYLREFQVTPLQTVFPLVQPLVPLLMLAAWSLPREGGFQGGGLMAPLGRLLGARSAPVAVLDDATEA